ncbi:MAG: histidinol-phosphatase HisJ family protein [Bacillota bacterium]|jgi:histidinol-phosphatase (PHP family)|nr:histidinol-phosphatase HisJ family protein [Bacillota bacterium]HHU29740.1 histidinol-phosphatase HisJ family protein [Bacillota bacterium]
MIVDYHLHTSRCGHATGEMAEYLAAARKRGVEDVGFADHFPLELLGEAPKRGISMAAEELEGYFAEIKELQQTVDIPVKIGAEVDYFPGREETAAKVLAGYDFDYLIGSVHYLDGWDFTHPGRRDLYAGKDIMELYRQYFAAICRLAESGLFDIVGHLDVIKKFGYFPPGDWTEIIDKTCRVLKETGICVEFNTSGWRAPVGEAYPGPAFLQKCRELGVPVTLGSDAHSVRDAGRGLDRAVRILRQLGFREIAVFSGRRRTMCPLPPV